VAFTVVLAVEPEARIAAAARRVVVAALIALRAPIAVVDADAVVVVVVVVVVPEVVVPIPAVVVVVVAPPALEGARTWRHARDEAAGDREGQELHEFRVHVSGCCALVDFVGSAFEPHGRKTIEHGGRA